MVCFIVLKVGLGERSDNVKPIKKESLDIQKICLNINARLTTD